MDKIKEGSKKSSKILKKNRTQYLTLKKYLKQINFSFTKYKGKHLIVETVDFSQDEQ